MVHAINDKVAFFGIVGSFTYLAGAKYFGQDHTFVPCSTFRDVFKKIANGEVKYGVVPIENTLAGSIYENYDLLTEYTLKIVGEVSLRIEHALMVHPDQKNIALDGIVEVFSHQKAIEQCGMFLRKHPSLHCTAFSDTATAARHVAVNGDGKPWAAIAHPGNAELYDLSILEKNIEDDSQNYTRFLVVSGETRSDAKRPNKCSMAIYLAHEPGSLSRVFNRFALLNVNLMKIESRPLPHRPFEYIFYVDLILPEKCTLEDVIQDLEPYTNRLELLGLYAVAH